MYLLREKTFSNDSIKLVKLKDLLERIHSDKKNKILIFLRSWKKNLETTKFKRIFKARADNEGGLKTSYSITFDIAKKEKSYTIDEEIIILIKDVIENVIKKDSQPVPRCTPLSANTVQWYINEIGDDEKRTLSSEL